MPSTQMRHRPTGRAARRSASRPWVSVEAQARRGLGLPAALVALIVALAGLAAWPLVPGALAAPAPGAAEPKKPDAGPEDLDDLPAAPGRKVALFTDDDVCRAIELGRQHLISKQQADGSWPGHAGISALVYMTLAYLGEHPNREVMSKGLDYLMRQDPDRDFGGRQGYGVPIRVMGFSYIVNKLLGDKRALVRTKMMEDLMRIRTGQSTNGGWRYGLNGQGFDFSVTQWPVLAIREAALAGVEAPLDPLPKAREVYYSGQHNDGGWAYTIGGSSYGSMTAAGLASLFIIADALEPASGCPCTSGRSQTAVTETERRIDAALEWLAKNFAADKNPGKGGHNLYWLYCVERVGIAAGYKYFGTHNWYQEGARILLERQNLKGDKGEAGGWGSLINTSFALLFLYKGRAPVLFNKLKFDGVWNAHRRDLANLTQYMERVGLEQQCHWQIVDLRAPVDELHDAPILYITAESVPKFSDEDKKKLRAFTDTGGTIFVEASCGNQPVRSWFTRFAKELWPEWKLLRLGPDHDLWSAFYTIKTRPDLYGVDDGLRTAVVFCADDISCAWQTKAYTGKGYLFELGRNLHWYATDGAPMRAKLVAREPKPSERAAAPVKAGPQTTVRLARVRHGGNWDVGANYRSFARLARRLKERAGVALEVAEAGAVPFNAGGVAPADLAGHDAAYLTGSGALDLAPADREALKAYVAGGGFLWLEAAGGAPAFEESVRKVAGEMGWSLELLPMTHPLLTGRMEKALGCDLTTRVEFRRSLRVKRIGRPYAELFGLFAEGRLIGLYSPFDAVFSLNPYDAYQCRGYQPSDAEAVATNIVLHLTGR